jgi:hypothetical protein
MKRQWEDPAKRQASEATLNTQGSFAAFTDAMRRIVQVKPSAVRVPADAAKAKS